MSILNITLIQEIRDDQDILTELKKINPTIEEILIAFDLNAIITYTKLKNIINH